MDMSVRVYDQGLGIWHYFARHAHNLVSISQTTGRPIRRSVYSKWYPEVSRSLTNIYRLWMYKRFLVADGNFVLNHRERKTGEDAPVWLTDGAAFMAQRSDYRHFVENTKERKQVCENLFA